MNKRFPVNTQLVVGLGLVALGIFLFIKVYFLLGAVVFFLGGGVLQGIKKGKLLDFSAGSGHDGYGGDGGCGGGD